MTIPFVSRPCNFSDLSYWTGSGPAGKRARSIVKTKACRGYRETADAMNQNDAVAAAACFTPDGIYVTDGGPVSGREAFQKWYADLFQKVQFSNHVITVDQDSPHALGSGNNQMWATGAWSTTIKGENFGPTQIRGFWSVIREGDDWKIRMLTSNTTPAPAAPSSRQAHGMTTP